MDELTRRLSGPPLRRFAESNVDRATVFIRQNYGEGWGEEYGM